MVPILAPNVSGYILSRVITPTPTKGVKAEVNILDDCTIIVHTAPISIARYPVPCLPHLPVKGKTSMTE